VIFVVFSFVMRKDSDFSSQITRINTDYFIEKWSQNETGTFRNKKTGKKKVFYPDISWLENSEFVSGYFYIFYYVLFLRLKQIRSI